MSVDSQVWGQWKGPSICISSTKRQSDYSKVTINNGWNLPKFGGSHKADIQ